MQAIGAGSLNQAMKAQHLHLIFSNSSMKSLMLFETFIRTSHPIPIILGVKVPD